MKQFLTLGLQLKKDEGGPMIIECYEGNPLTHIGNWRMVIKNTLSYSVNDITIVNNSNTTKTRNEIPHGKCQIIVVHESPPTIHHETGIAQLSFDQFVHVS